MVELTGPVAKLRMLLPVLLEKEKNGLILPSYTKAKDLVRWAEIGRPLTEKQEQFIGRLIVRAERKHTLNKMDIKIQHEGAPAAPPVDVEAIADKVFERMGSKSVDTNAVAEIVLKKLEQHRKVEIVIRDKAKAIKVQGTPHVRFEHLARAATARLVSGYVPGIFLQGEASSGKTMGTAMLAEAMKLKWYFNGAISFPHEMLGFIDGAGKYHRTPFRDAYEHGGVYTFDEVDRSDPVALLAVNPHLAGEVATFPDKQVKRHRDCIIICTANTWGLGADANYSGATKLDGAFLSRFPIRISWDIDEKLEETIVKNPAWLARVRAARQRARAVGLKVMIDTRISQAGAALVEVGYSLDEAANMTYLANLKPEQRKQVEGVS